MISTGLPYLDEVTGGLKLGDNVVWQVSGGVPVDIFIKAFFDNEKVNYNSVIYINFNYSPQTIAKRYSYLFKNTNSILVDAFTHGKGNSDPVFSEFYENQKDNLNIISIEDPKNKDSVISVLNKIEETNKDGSFYIFDSLTGMNELWKDEHTVLDFFAFSCPKLYDLNTLAYWIYEKDAHTREFKAGITHITQIVFSISVTNMDNFQLVVKKIEDRTSHQDPKPHYFKIQNKAVRFLHEKHESVIKIGDIIKSERSRLKMTQSNLAAMLNMTPGALSQIENDLTTPSLQTLIILASVFEKPLDFFVNPDASNKKSYKRINTVEMSSVASKYTIRRIIETDENNCKIYSITIEPHKEIVNPLLLHKGSEIIILLSGELSIYIQNEKVTVIIGESLYIDSAFIDKWENPGDKACSFMYILL